MSTTEKLKELAESKLQAMLDIKEQYQKKMREEGEGLVKNMVRAFLDDNPDALAIKWCQYTPYFNDGDPCVFEVSEPYVRLKSIEAYNSNRRQSEWHKDVTSMEELNKLGHNEDGFIDGWGFADTSPIRTNLQYFGNVLSKSKDILLLVIGDHAEVTVTADSLKIEEYDHD